MTASIRKRCGRQAVCIATGAGGQSSPCVFHLKPNGLADSSDARERDVDLRNHSRCRLRHNCAPQRAASSRSQSSGARLIQQCPVLRRLTKIRNQHGHQHQLESAATS
jgi:hypothetical protein